MHLREDSIFNTTGSIRRQAYAFFIVIGKDGLDEADNADGDQLLLIPLQGMVLFRNMGDQPQVMQDQFMLGKCLFFFRTVFELQ